MKKPLSIVLIVIALAGGWHSGAIARTGEHYARPFYETPDALIVRLELRRPDGTPELLLASDASWSVSDQGPLRYSDLYMGEMFDGTRDEVPPGIPAKEVAIGLAPDNKPFEAVVALENGYVKSNESCLTAREGVFTAGDCRTKQIRQVVTATADGASAALAACRYLDRL